jgi:cytochrome c peroxidase
MKKVAAILVLGLLIGSLISFLPSGSGGVRLSFKGDPKTKQQLGEMLFFEKKLSADQTISCASCHIPSHGFADTLPLSKGVKGHLGKRNAPGCTNLSARPYFFYDGRAATLESQVKFPIEDKNEMAVSIDVVVARLCKDSKYNKYFATIFKDKPTVEHLEDAIASFERTLETANSPFDRYMNGDSLAISESAIRGRELFMGTKAKCFDCHFRPDFTGDEFRNIGLFDGKKYKDSGRYDDSRDLADIGKFKVPGLRNVAATAPYMHNGMFKTLAEVIEYYDNPYKVVPNPINTDSLLSKPLNLTQQEKIDLENFLISLTDDKFPLAGAAAHRKN